MGNRMAISGFITLIVAFTAIFTGAILKISQLKFANEIMLSGILLTILALVFLGLGVRYGKAQEHARGASLIP